MSHVSRPTSHVAARLHAAVRGRRAEPRPGRRRAAVVRRRQEHHPRREWVTQYTVKVITSRGQNQHRPRCWPVRANLAVCS